jgi:hypothetical protein
VEKSGCSLPDFSKRLREATFFVAFRSRGISIARPPSFALERYSWSRNSEKTALEQTAEISWPVFDLESIFAAASDALSQSFLINFTHSSLGSFFKLKKLRS